MNTTRRQLLKAVPFVAAGLFVPHSKAQTQTIPLDQGILDALTDAVRQAIQTHSSPLSTSAACPSGPFCSVSRHVARQGRAQAGQGPTTAR